MIESKFLAESRIHADNRKNFTNKALKLEYLTVGWNIVEGAIAISAAVMAGSVALLGFGIDSVVESISGAILIWRLRAEETVADQQALDQLDHRARKLVALSLFLLSAYVAVDSLMSFWSAEKPQSSIVGIALTSVSIGVMWWLAKAKRRIAKIIGSRALEADAFQTTACWWLSIVTLAGIGLNTLFGWWWADSAAGIVIAYLIVREALENWRGEQCGCQVTPTM